MRNDNLEYMSIVNKEDGDLVLLKSLRGLRGRGF